MSYIYDILINFNKNLYEFYDWNLNDDIDHVRKIPVFKVDSATLWDIKNNAIIFKNQFLNQICNKTEVFTVKNLKNLKYACLFCDGMETIAVEVTESGLKKSKLLIDEEEEVIEVCSKLEVQRIEYKILHELKVEQHKTRKEVEMEEFVKEQIRNLSKETDTSKLHYLYYECFNEKENDKNKIIDRFRLEMSKNFDQLVQKLYQFFKLLQFNQ